MGRLTRAVLAGGLATLALASPATAATARGGVITGGTLRLSDVPSQPWLSIGDRTVPERDAGTTDAAFTVMLSHPADGDVTVHWATSDGTATAPADYTASSGDLTFTPGQIARTFSVPVVGDTVVESEETFGVSLSSPIGGALATATAIGTIINDDGVPVIDVGNATVDPEGDTGTKPATFTVSLSAPTTATVQVGYATANVTATAPADYITTSGIVTFTPGQTRQTVTVDVNGDTLVEGSETFRLQLFSPVAGTLGTAQGTGTIVDDDQPPVVKPPGGVTGSGVFCGTQHRGACKGLQFTAQFQSAPGNASWTFDAYNPTPGNSGKTRAHTAAITYVRVGTLKKAITSKAPVKVTFKVKGTKANTILKKIKRKKLTRLRITTTFTSSTGKKTKTVSVVKLR